MIALKNALKKAEDFRRSEVKSCGDCGDRWVFSFKEDEGKIGGAPVVVYKTSGACEYFSVADYIIKGIFENIKPIDLSEVREPKND